VTGCVHFSFFKATLDCHLTDAFALRGSSAGAIGFLSGPFHCWGGIPNQDKYVQLGPKTYVPKELDCMNIGEVYMPEMAPPRIFPPVLAKNGLARGLNTIHNCKELCLVIEGCEHFSVHFPDGLCSLAAANARPVTSIESAISGRKGGGCKVPIQPLAAVTDVALGPHLRVGPEPGTARRASTAVVAAVFVATIATLASLGLYLRSQWTSWTVLQHEVNALMGETDV